MKNFLAIGLACALPIALAAEDCGPAEAYFGTANVLVIDDNAPQAVSLACARTADAKGECMAFNRAVLTAHTHKVSALRERGRWI